MPEDRIELLEKVTQQTTTAGNPKLQKRSSEKKAL